MDLFDFHEWMDDWDWECLCEYMWCWCACGSADDGSAYGEAMACAGTGMESKIGIGTLKG